MAASRGGAVAAARSGLAAVFAALLTEAPTTAAVVLLAGWLLGWSGGRLPPLHTRQEILPGADGGTQHGQHATGGDLPPLLLLSASACVVGLCVHCGFCCMQWQLQQAMYTTVLHIMCLLAARMCSLAASARCLACSFACS
jgi:hypothetical protein